METKERLVQCLEETGIFIDLQESDIDLRDYIIDSMQFITSIIAIESEFQIEIPSELLLYDNLISMNSFCEIIDEITLSGEKTDYEIEVS